MMFCLIFCLVLVLVVVMFVMVELVFNCIFSFVIVDNMVQDQDCSCEILFEIMMVMVDGMELIYFDVLLGVIGLIDIVDFVVLKLLGNIVMDGELMIIVVLGEMVFVGVNILESYVVFLGVLCSVDLMMKQVVVNCDLGGQLDLVVLLFCGDMLVVVIENECDEEVNDGVLLQMLVGFVVCLFICDGQVDCGNLQWIELIGFVVEGGDDFELEYVDFNVNGDLVVMFQENNYIVVIGVDGQIVLYFSVGMVDLDGIDIECDGKLDFIGVLKVVLCEFDMVVWLDNDYFVIVNEGDYKGGLCGFMIWNCDGLVVYEFGLVFEYELIKIGYYFEKWFDKKGVEFEVLKYVEFDGQKLLFVGLECGSVIGVYDVVNLVQLVLWQILFLGIGLEGLVVILQCNLFVSVNEIDLGEDGVVCVYVMIFQCVEGMLVYLIFVLDQVMGWLVLLGLIVDLIDFSVFYVVSDSVYGKQFVIYCIQIGIMFVRIFDKIVVIKDGQFVENFDFEGIIVDGQGGFWLVSEGNLEKDILYQILYVNGEGVIQQQIELFVDLVVGLICFGFEGIVLVVDGSLWMVVQCEWKDDFKGQIKLLNFNLVFGVWFGVCYLLEMGEGWVGLLEIVIYGDQMYLIEWDNLIGQVVKLKIVILVVLVDLKFVLLGGDLLLVIKMLVCDLIFDLKQWNGYVQDKVEGMVIMFDGMFYVVIDNDGVDDSLGEIFFWLFKF